MNRDKAKAKQKYNKTITPEDHLTWIGKVICKHSGKRFTTDEKIAVPTGIETNPFSGKQAFVIEDGTLVDCYQCKLFEEAEKEFEFSVFEHIERGTRFFTNYSPDEVVSGLNLVRHCKTSDEAQKLCKVTEAKNFAWYYFNLFKEMDWRY